MRRTKETAHILIILRVLVLIAYDEADRASRGFAFEDTTQQFHAVTFLAVCGDAALSGLAPVQFLLNEVHIHLNTCRHTVNDAADGCSVALAEGSQRKDISESVAHSYAYVFN